MLSFKAAALAFSVGKFDKKVFQAAILTVLLVATVSESAPWKYVSSMIREVVATVQTDAMPWLGADGRAPPDGGRGPKVAALLIGDDLFASKEGFGHQVPLPNSQVLAFLSALWAVLPSKPLLVIDFDLAPRVGEDQGKRIELDKWLEDHADHLVLVEPTWATRSPETLGRQIRWTQKMCGLSDGSGIAEGKRAVFAQSTLASQFGFIQDWQPLSGDRRPTWDIGRATADHIGGGEHRNPLCDRLLGEWRSLAAGAPLPDMMELLKFQLTLGRELQRFGALQIQSQPFLTKGRGNDVLLRSEYLQDHADCRPKRFDDLPKLECLTGAKVVVIGGAWSFGATDRHDTFVGEMDGAAVHTAWIRSWLTPAIPINKGLQAFADLAMQWMLYPILSYLFFQMRRSSTAHMQRLDDATEAEKTQSEKSATSPSLRPRAFGLHVSVTVCCLVLAAATVAATAFAMILMDGLLRWSFDRALSLDATITALLLWCGLSLGGLIFKQEHPRGIQAAKSAAALGTICLLVSAAAYVVGEAATKPIVLTLAAVTIVLMIVGGFLAKVSLGAEHEAHHKKPKTFGEWYVHLIARATGMRRTIFSSMRTSVDIPRSRRGGLVRVRQLSLWIAEPIGTVLWVFIFGYGFCKLVKAAVWDPFAFAVFGG
jgi:hypothetical protein